MKKTMLYFMSKHYVRIAIICSISFVIAVVLAIYVNSWFVMTVLKIISAILLAANCVLIGIKRYCKANVYVKVLSRFSLEVYLFHGLCFRLYMEWSIRLRSEVLFSVLSLMTCFAL